MATIQERLAAEESTRQLHDAVGKLMADKSGRVFINWLIEQCHIYHFCSTPEQEGERRIGLKVIALLNEHPDLNIKMLQQNLADLRADENSKKQQKGKDNDET